MHVKHVSYNGELHPADSFNVTLQNRAFRYGDGIFETMRSRGVHIPFYAFHYERLIRGMELFKMSTDGLSAGVLLKAIERLIHADKLYNGNSIRISVFRNEGGKYAPETNTISYIIEATPLSTNAFVINDKGLFIDTYETHFKSSSRLGNFKNCSSLLLVLAGNFMNKRKLDDVLILNEKNYLVEALSSNIFVLKGKQLFTPSLATGCVDGVMRRIVIAIATEKKYTIIESDTMVPEDLLDADEVFITNALRGINWVVAFKNKRYLYQTSRLFLKAINERAGFIAS
jgi:branched-subunit amino acid aminotransferase/4-amino-4-deoxychorismate lyase